MMTGTPRDRMYDANAAGQTDAKPSRRPSLPEPAPARPGPHDGEHNDCTRPARNGTARLGEDAPTLAERSHRKAPPETRIAHDGEAKRARLDHHQLASRTPCPDVSHLQAILQDHSQAGQPPGGDDASSVDWPLIAEQPSPARLE